MLIFKRGRSCKTGCWHLPHSVFPEKWRSQWSFRIQLYLKSTSCAHTNPHTHTLLLLCRNTLLHTPTACRHPFIYLHTFFSSKECLAVPLFLAECELFWWMNRRVEQRVENCASSGGWLTVLSEILQILEILEIMQTGNRSNLFNMCNYWSLDHMLCPCAVR